MASRTLRRNDLILTPEWNMESQNSNIGTETSLLKTIRQTFNDVLIVDFSESKAAPGKIQDALTAFFPIYSRMKDGTRQPTATEVNTVTAHLSLAYSYAVGRCPKRNCDILSVCIDALAEYKWFLEAQSKKK
jgi:hypothetical protein